MPDFARYVVLGAFWLALVACIGTLVRGMLARQRRARNELLARRMARGF